MKRVFTIGERVWDEKNRVWGIIVSIKGNNEREKCPADKSDIIGIRACEDSEVAEKDALFLVTAKWIYQVAPYSFQGEETCWEHNDTRDDYPLYCPAREENCFFIEVSPALTTKKKVFVVTINEVSDFEQYDYTPVVFSKREDAEKYLAQAKKEAIEDYEPDDKGESEEECGMCISANRPDYFALYERYSWSKTHYEVTFDECEIQ